MALTLLTGCWYAHPITGILPRESEDSPDFFWLLAFLGASTCNSGATGFASGSGTAADPFMICNVDQLQRMQNNSSASYQLMQDIDAAATPSWNGGAGFIPIGSNSDQFSGTLDGQYFTIANLFINRPGASQTGLFGQTSMATIHKLNLTTVQISGLDQTGAIIGLMNGGLLEEVSSTGSVSGYANLTGGLVGVLEGSGLIRRSYSKAAVVQNIGTINAGGIAGLVQQSGIVQEVYFAGSVSGPAVTSKLGGIIGHVYNNGGCAAPESVLHSFNYGTISGPSDAAGVLGQLQGCTGTQLFCLDTQDLADQECRNDTSGGSATGGRRTQAQLTCATAPASNCNGMTTYSGWDAGVWNFGDSTQMPWLRWSGSVPP